MSDQDPFADFLLKKKIDREAFAKAMPAEFADLQTLFAQMGENSFDQQKKFILNNLRLEHPLKVAPEEEARPLNKPAAPRPILKRNPGTS